MKHIDIHIEGNNFTFTFVFDSEDEEGIKVTIKMVLNSYSGAGMVITNMTTLPEEQRGNWYGSRALKILLLWARNRNLKNIIVSQVTTNSEGFWLKNDFLKMNNATNDFLYTIQYL